MPTVKDATTRYGMVSGGIRSRSRGASQQVADRQKDPELVKAAAELFRAREAARNAGRPVVGREQDMANLQANVGRQLPVAPPPVGGQQLPAPTATVASAVNYQPRPLGQSAIPPPQGQFGNVNLGSQPVGIVAPPNDVSRGTSVMADPAVQLAQQRYDFVRGAIQRGLTVEQAEAEQAQQAAQQRQLDLLLQLQESEIEKNRGAAASSFGSAEASRASAIKAASETLPRGLNIAKGVAGIIGQGARTIASTASAAAARSRAALTDAQRDQIINPPPPQIKPLTPIDEARLEQIKLENEKIRRQMESPPATLTEQQQERLDMLKQRFTANTRLMTQRSTNTKENEEDRTKRLAPVIAEREQILAEWNQLTQGTGQPSPASSVGILPPTSTFTAPPPPDIVGLTDITAGAPSEVPVPRSKTELVNGQIYQTSRGRARWDASKNAFVPVQ